MPRRNRYAWMIWGTVFLTQVGLWFLLVAKWDPVELLAAVPGAALAALAVAVFDALGLVHFRPTIGQLLEAWRIPWYLLTGTWEILHGLALQLFARRGAPSVLSATPFEVRGSHAAAQATLAVTYTTLTPNFVVLGIVAEQRLLLYHQILPGPVLTMTRNLESLR